MTGKNEQGANGMLYKLVSADKIPEGATTVPLGEPARGDISGDPEEEVTETEGVEAPAATTNETEAALELAEATPASNAATPFPAASPTAGAPAAPVVVVLLNAKGRESGTATFAEGLDDVAITVTVKGMEAGEHGIHVHETGVCDATTTPRFFSAGRHFNPDRAKHGGPPPAADGHAGDLGNITIDDNRGGELSLTSDRFTLADLQDGDGSALIIHQDPDDLKTNPEGNSGPRTLCGIIFPPQGSLPANNQPEATPNTDQAATEPLDSGIVVDMADIYFDPDRITIPADTEVRISLVNSGETVHNFTIEEQNVSVDLEPGDTTEEVLNLPRSSYEFICDIPGHKQAGMVGVIEVQ
jgi:Cu-Zn family superoxide dismutase